MERRVSLRLLHGLDRLAKDHLIDTVTLPFSALQGPNTSGKQTFGGGDWLCIGYAAVVWPAKQIRSRSQGSHTILANITVTIDEREALFVRPAKVALQLTSSLDCVVSH